MKLDFYYDFGSPNAYMAWKALSAMPGVELIMHPVLIGGLFKTVGNQPPWQARPRRPAKMSYMMVEIQRFAKMYGLGDFKMNPHFPVNTLLAMRAAMAAQAAGVHDTFVPAVFRAMWEDGVDVSKPEELARVLSDAGLDGKALVAATQTDAVKQALMQATQDCADRGAFGLPTWFTPDGEMYFGKDCCWMMHPEADGLTG